MPGTKAQIVVVTKEAVARKYIDRALILGSPMMNHELPTPPETKIASAYFFG